MPKVSVIIPTYNRAQYVTEAVDSVLGQSYSDYEVVIVDDGSKDETQEVLLNYGDRIRYFYQENAGVSAARNRGIRESRGEWVAFLDSDDVWLPEKLEKQIKAVEANPEVTAHLVDLLLPPHEKGITQFQVCGYSFSGEAGVLEDPLRLVLYHVILPSGFMCLREFAISCGLFEEGFRYSEDRDFMCRLSLEGTKRWGYLHEVHVCLHRREEGDLSLSGLSRRDSAEFDTILYETHERLLRSEKISARDRALVAERQAGVCRKLGMDLLRSGKKKEANRYICRLQELDPGLKVFLLRGIAGLPGRMGEGLANVWFRRRRQAAGN